ncbi:hypothetical protein ATB99_16345 [Elizabethkingia meningoseptica]|uniref:hypothetical protein n=1 Tax=Elizabethkingia meningoseptica TaxID=238 RepID=UPI000332C9E0|nr:hypothetical protein [Elizabethkingia meningoseptica]AQX06118.1 hypothetical protein BBD33_13030 [Elizabethkingia meningoseptica]AQX48164.1 hypothetical protein B5G46_13020 [Elizabethkingia meningoseptica]EOR30229.1 hypothetical protein L100_07074 [Elizabethkingia meningoseptica ATCC 13253 = NBRC 12535]KUY23351.1 hypothetical protein ATB99_16345 [Elizabethkingia meningoseptica]OPB71499.1 hypothetical protein BAY30_02700 [Elizabethkingia meningoseptica]
MLLFVHIIIAISGSWLTFYLNRYLKLGAVKSSSLLALIVGGIYQLNQSFLHYDIPQDIPFLVIGSTFIGMITSRKHYRNFNLFVAPIIFTIIYYNISKEFNGFGGAIGTAACISLLIAIYLRSLKATKKVIKPFRQVKVETMKRNRHKKISHTFSHHK